MTAKKTTQPVAPAPTPEPATAFARGLGSMGKLDWPVKSKLPERLYWMLMADCTSLKTDVSSEIRNVLCLHYIGKSYDEIMLEEAVHDEKVRAAARAGKGHVGSHSGAPNAGVQ